MSSQLPILLFLVPFVDGRGDAPSVREAAVVVSRLWRRVLSPSW